jgi:hypothetical protein
MRVQPLFLFRKEIDQHRADSAMIKNIRDMAVTRALPAASAAVREQDNSPGSLRQSQVGGKLDLTCGNANRLVLDMLQYGFHVLVLCILRAKAALALPKGHLPRNRSVFSRYRDGTARLDAAARPPW